MESTRFWATALVAAATAALWTRFYAVPFFWRWAAARAAKSGRFGAAESFYLRAAAISPRDFALWLAVGRVRRRRGAVDSALDALQRAGDLAPNRAEIFAERVEILRNEGRRAEALKELDRVVEKNGAPLEALLTRAAVALELGRFRAVVGDCERALDQIDRRKERGEIAPDDENAARALHFRGVAELALGREADAESDFEAAYLLDPEFPEARDALRARRDAAKEPSRRPGRTGRIDPF